MASLFCTHQQEPIPLKREGVKVFILEVVLDYLAGQDDPERDTWLDTLPEPEKLVLEREIYHILSVGQYRDN